MTFKIYYGGCFVYDLEIIYVKWTINLEKIKIDVYELHIILLHKLALEMDDENVETFDVESTRIMAITC